jgi:hypothetical protein
MSSPTVQNVDVEAQTQATKATDAGVEYTVPTHKKLIALSGYFFLSLGLTLQSKMLLGKVRDQLDDLLRNY